MAADLAFLFRSCRELHFVYWFGNLENEGTGAVHAGMVAFIFCMLLLPLPRCLLEHSHSLVRRKPEKSFSAAFISLRWPWSTLWDLCNE
jgi:hypothetical protein